MIPFSWSFRAGLAVAALLITLAGLAGEPAGAQQPEATPTPAGFPFGDIGPQPTGTLPPSAPTASVLDPAIPVVPTATPARPALPGIPQRLEDLPSTPVPTPYPLGVAPGSWKAFISEVGPLRFYEVEGEGDCLYPPAGYETRFIHLPGNLRSKILCFEMALFYSRPVEYDVMVRFGTQIYRDGRWLGEGDAPVRIPAGRGRDGVETLRGPLGEVYAFTPGFYDIVLAFDNERVTTGRFETVATVNGLTGCGPGGIQSCPTAVPRPVIIPFGR